METMETISRYNEHVTVSHINYYTYCLTCFRFHKDFIKAYILTTESIDTNNNQNTDEQKSLHCLNRKGNKEGCITRKNIFNYV